MTTVTLRSLAVLVGLASAAGWLGACGGSRSPAGTLRFHNQDPIWVINDRRDVPKQPEEPRWLIGLYHFDGVWHKRLDRWLSQRPERRATNVNSMDEVPDSTWFTNRIGVRDMTVDEIRVGPNVTGSPEAHRPWVIKSSKVGGINIGFIIKDQRGIKYVLKFDENEIPEMETAANMILQRLLWACGYNVPEDYIVTFRPEDLILADDAVIKDPAGGEKPLTAEFLAQQLALVTKNQDGSIRGGVSQFIPGIPVGGHARDGVREDDPNDTTPHQYRRELRGNYAIWSWLDHTDMKHDNTFDTYVEDPANPKVHYVLHYFIDFGKGLSTQGYINGRRWVGFSHFIHFGHLALSSITLGLWRRPWEGREAAGIRGVGLLESELYHPGKWKAYMPSYFPFHDVDRFDGFWGSKILVRFTREQIRAAVEVGEFSDPRATAYVTETLVRRQRKTARYWFDRVNPLDRFEVEKAGDGYRLCFEDLAVRYNLGDQIATGTRYRARAFDRDGRKSGWTAQAAATPSGRACVDGLRPSKSTDGYTIVELRTSRTDARLPPTLVHLAVKRKTGALRVIGLKRL